MLFFNTNYKKELGIISSIFFIILGAIIALLSIFAFNIVLDIFFVCVGIIIILMNVFPLVVAITLVSQDNRYITDIVFSGIAIILGTLFIFNHDTAVSIVFAVFLVVMPLIRIVLAKDKVKQAKKEIPLFIVAAVLLTNEILKAVTNTDIIYEITKWTIASIGILIALYGVVKLVITLVKKEPEDDDDIDPFGGIFLGGDNNNDNNDEVIIDAEVKEL